MISVRLRVPLAMAFAFFSTTFTAQSDSARFKSVAFTISAGELLPDFFLNTANFNLGADLPAGNRHSIFLNVGYVRSYGPPDPLWGISSYETSGFKAQCEVRRFFGRTKLIQPLILLVWPHIFQYHSTSLANTGYYLAAHAYFQLTSTDRPFESFSSQIGNANHRADFYIVRRNATALLLHAGYQCIKRNGLTVDVAVGAGAQYVSSRPEDMQSLRFSDSHEEELWGKPFDYGSAVVPAFSYKVRIGWAF